jgi:hypothetical protein
MQIAPYHSSLYTPLSPPSNSAVRSPTEPSTSDGRVRQMCPASFHYLRISRCVDRARPSERPPIARFIRLNANAFFISTPSRVDERRLRLVSGRVGGRIGHVRLQYTCSAHAITCAHHIPLRHRRWRSRSMDCTAQLSFAFCTVRSLLLKLHGVDIVFVLPLPSFLPPGCGRRPIRSEGVRLVIHSRTCVLDRVHVLGSRPVVARLRLSTSFAS